MQSDACMHCGGSREPEAGDRLQQARTETLVAEKADVPDVPGAGATGHQLGLTTWRQQTRQQRL